MALAKGFTHNLLSDKKEQHNLAYIKLLLCRLESIDSHPTPIPLFPRRIFYFVPSFKLWNAFSEFFLP
jgi:hypothetical protein